MLLNNSPSRTVYLDDELAVKIIDQTQLPFAIKWLTLTTLDDACVAICDMQVRGAPAIGAVAAFAMMLAARENSDLQSLQLAAQKLKATRPTAVNLAWAVDQQILALEAVAEDARVTVALDLAEKICADDVQACEAIGDNGADIIAALAEKNPGQTINVLTHCNAGWLATVDWGTALAPIYKAQARGIDVHVWVDETRPRNQGALLTAFELTQQGVKNTLICDNAGGHLMQQGKVDLCLVGSDRTTANGDVCNKIGTYLKALAAADNTIPFYVALPTSTIDWHMSCGADIPIEERSVDEVLTVSGVCDGQTVAVGIAAEGTMAANPAFDVTPAKYVTGLITEYGVYSANTGSLRSLRSQVESNRG